MRTILIATTLLAASFSTSFAQMPERYNPGPAKASTAAPVPKVEQAPAPKRDLKAEAQQRFATWQDAKRQCYVAAGLEEGKTFRLAADGTKFQVNDRVYIDPKFDSNKVAACNQ